MDRADLILVTHHHKDHCKRVTLDRLKRPDTLVVAPKRCVRELGEDIRIVKPADAFSFGSLIIKTVHAYNAEKGSSSKKQHKKGEGVGYLITIEGKKIYHAGDTDFIAEMRELGPVDVALLPIGGTFTMDLDEAVDAAIAINPQVVIPMHRFGADPEEFADKIESRSDIRVIPLAVGQTYRL